MQFFTPPDHVGFEATKLFGKTGGINDIAIAYIMPGGGDPQSPHTHEHDHLFIVTEGEAKIILGDDSIIIGRNQSFLVKGSVAHSVWNNCQSQTVMIGISINNKTVDDNDLIK